MTGPSAKPVALIMQRVVAQLTWTVAFRVLKAANTSPSRITVMTTHFLQHINR